METDSPTGAPSWPWWWWWWWCWWWTVLIWQHAVAKECRLAIREVGEGKKKAPRRRGSESKTGRTSAIARSRRLNVDTMRSSSCYSRVVGSRRDYPPIRSSPNCDGELQPGRFIITLCVSLSSPLPSPTLRKRRESSEEKNPVRPPIPVPV